MMTMTSLTCSSCRKDLEFATKEDGGREFPARLVHTHTSNTCRRFGPNPKITLRATLRAHQQRTLAELATRRDEIAALRFRIEALDDRVDFIVPEIIESLSDPDDENFLPTEDSRKAAIVSLETDANEDRQRVIALQLFVELLERTLPQMEDELAAVRERLRLSS